MSKLEIEVLFSGKKEKLEPKSIKNVLNGEFYELIKENEHTIVDNNNEYKLKFLEKKLDHSLYLKISYDYNKKLTKKEVIIIQSFLKKMSIVASKNGFFTTTLKNDCFLYYTKKLISYFYNYEWSLRRFIYLIISANIRNNWIENTLTSEVQDEIKKREKGDFKKQNFLQYLTLFQIEEYLFEENYISMQFSNEESSVLKYKEIDHKKLIELLKKDDVIVSSPYSLWNELFSEHSDIDSTRLKKDMEEIREGRNSVMHGKEIDDSKYNSWIKIINKYIKEFSNASNQILQGKIDNEILITAYEDFKVYVELSRQDASLSHLASVGLNTISSSLKNQLTGVSDSYTNLASAGMNTIGSSLKSQLVGASDSYTKLANVGKDIISSSLKSQLSDASNSYTKLTSASINAIGSSLKSQLIGVPDSYARLTSAGLSTISSSLKNELIGASDSYTKLASSGLNTISNSLKSQLMGVPSSYKNISESFSDSIALQYSNLDNPDG